MIFLYIVFLHKYIMYILLDDDNSNLGVNYIWATAIKKGNLRAIVSSTYGH